MIHTNDENIMFFKNHPKNTSPPHLNQPHPIFKTKQKSRKTRIPRRTVLEANTRCLSRRSCTYQDVGPGEEPKKSPTLGRFFSFQGTVGTPKGTPKKWGPWRPSWGGLRGPKTCDQKFWEKSLHVRFFWRILIRPFFKKSTTLFFVNVLGVAQSKTGQKKTITTHSHAHGTGIFTYENQ